MDKVKYIFKNAAYTGMKLPKHIDLKGLEKALSKTRLGLKLLSDAKGEKIVSKILVKNRDNAANINRSKGWLKHYPPTKTAELDKAQTVFEKLVKIRD